MYSLGIDIGTSGIRAIIMDAQHNIQAQAQHALPPGQPYYSGARQIIGYAQNPRDWWQTFEAVIFQLSQTFQLKLITHLAIDGTSGTVLLADQNGNPCSEALMYNDQRAFQQAELIKKQAPENTAAIGASSGLAKLLWLNDSYLKSSNSFYYALNQSDWINGKLLGKYGLSDHNNALKMGYDAQNQCWPDWLLALLEQQNFPVSSLPKVFFPGHIMGTVNTSSAQHFGFNPDLQICAGTTDSTAAIIASGAEEPGDAVTSLGSTLVMKVISQHPVFDQPSGVYSQPYGDLWLAGGSSNSGGEVLKHYFSPQKLSQYTAELNLKISQKRFKMLDLNFYPLSSPGERFPIQDPGFEPRLSPRPEHEIDFFQALLEGMADIETMAYQRLLELGAPYPKLVRSIGGGAINKAWRYIREQKLGRPVLLSDQEQAAAGSAILAQTMWL